MNKRLLSNLFKKYKSDKYHHKYSEIYEKYLNVHKNKKVKVLEIGVADGSSVKAWSRFFNNGKVIGIDIKDVNKKKLKIKTNNIDLFQGSQSDYVFLKKLINKYKNFDFIIDDGSHYPKDVIKSFKFLFPYLKNGGIYFIEDTQTSYNHFFGGNPFDLKYANTHLNFFKNLSDCLNYKEIPNPFYIKNPFDGLITNVSFYRNIVVVTKNINEIESNLVKNNSYENKRYITKTKRNKNKLKYFIKYLIFFKIYTFLFYIYSLIKRIILLRF
tara:strand:- start:321 stop:1130 length:810 start_codon:yes stop_codon:yes gene_type:complete